MDKKIFLYSFCSEGLPKDEGLPLLDTAVEFQRICKDEGKVDKTFLFTPSSIPEEYKWCVKPFPDEGFIMGGNPGYNKIGLGAWRGYLLYHALHLNSEIQEGDVLLIHDVNFKKHSEFLNLARNTKEICTRIVKMLEKEDGSMFMPMHPGGWNIYSFCRSCVISHMLGEKDGKDFDTLTQVGSLPLGRACMTVVIVNKKTKAFSEKILGILKEYQDSILAQDCLNDSKMINRGFHFAHPRTKFSHHTAEQPIFNLLAYQEKLFTKNVKNPLSWIYHIFAYNGYSVFLQMLDNFLKKTENANY